MIKNILYFIQDSAFRFLGFSWVRKLASAINNHSSFLYWIPITVGSNIMRASSLDRFLAICLWKYGVLESFETQIFKKVVQPGMTVVDIGANIGYYTLQFSTWVGPQGRVWAFEPEPRNHRILSDVIADNKITNVDIFPVAISNEAGSHKLFVSGENQGDHRFYDPTGDRPSIEIPTARLDDFFSGENRRVDVIKMDIQGSEYAALLGMQETIKQNPQIIIVSEFSPKILRDQGVAADKFIQLLDGLKLNCWYIDEKKKSLRALPFSELVEICEKETIASLYLEKSSQPTYRVG